MPPARGRRRPPRFGVAPVVLAVGTELLIRLGGLVLVLGVALVVLWTLRQPPEARRSDPSEWDPTADEDDEEVELFRPGTGGLIVDTGDGRTYEAHETKAIQAAASYVDRNDDATVADLKTDVFRDNPARHGDPDEWWTETVRPGMAELTDAEIPPEEAERDGEPERNGEDDDGETDHESDDDRRSDDRGESGPPDEWEGSERFDHEVRGDRGRGTLVEVRDGDRSAEFFVDVDRVGSPEVEPSSTIARGHGDEWVRDASQYLREWYLATQRDAEFER